MLHNDFHHQDAKNTKMKMKDQPPAQETSYYIIAIRQRRRSNPELSLGLWITSFATLLPQ